ncbi:hypothetical protein V5799_027876 [Amblyomma americanum]|uniref:Ig-like domain-containing protein n=1 Tax=Amblyomma americanum TaxID=6943 RepID=A0AAQ4DEG9_AMBAM
MPCLRNLKCWEWQKIRSDLPASTFKSNDDADDDSGDGNGEDDDAIPTPLRLVVLEGEQTSLPCPIDMTSQEPVSALWYRVATGSFHTRYTRHDALKVYGLVAPSSTSVMLMGRPSLFDGEHWKQHSWKRRAFFSLLSDPPALLLNRLERADTGSYVCNVTYRRENVTSPTVTVTEARAELFVAVLQPPPVLTDSSGIVSNSTAGPYNEGDVVRLTCVVPAAGVPAGEHSSGLTCTVGNYTDTSFSLLCFMPPGENGTTSTRDPRRLLVEVLAAGQQDRSERSFSGPDLGSPVFVTGLLPSTDYLVVVRLPPDASFRTYVRTLGLAQTLKGRDDLTRSTQPGLWNTTLSIVVLTCAVAAALAALLGIYLVHAFKERWKKTRRSSTDFGNSAKAKDADSLYIRDQKSYVTAAECC